MIEVNLLPRAQRRRRRRTSGFALLLPAIQKLPGRFDRFLVFAVVAWLIGPALIGWLYFDLRGQKDDLTLAVEQAIQDSIHYATVNQAARTLRARRDTILEKLAIIEEFDARRYIWPHIMDEISRSLSDYTWIVSVTPSGSETAPQLQIQGRTGNNFALTEFMKNLEASPFIRDVTMTSTELTSMQGSEVYAFVLNATYQPPPPDVIQMVPYLSEDEQ